MKILIVDDSKAMRMIVLRTLRQAGFGNHEFAEACNGAEALKLFQEERYSLVISDWNMPEMTGIDLLKALREAGSKVNFGFVTSESSEIMRLNATEAGAKFFITKPFDADTFRSTFSVLLG